MTTEQTSGLLKSRYLVRTPWPPSSNFNKGDIVTPDQFTGWHPKDFPVIFRPLHWSEFRSVEEMPEYVKTTYNGTVNKVIKYDFETDTIFMEDPERPYQFSLKLYLSARVPATETEYPTTYIKSIKKQ